MTQIKKRLIKTNRIQLVHALYRLGTKLPVSGTLRDWCAIVERAFEKLGYAAYCHMSAQISLGEHAQKYGEKGRFDKAVYHCDLQHDISMLNRDTVDPSGANTDPLFPRDSLWIFCNDGAADRKSIDLGQLKRVFDAYKHIELDEQFMIASDGHKCLSSPELFIEEFMIEHGISHAKEGDLDTDGNKLTNYPFDSEFNDGKRSKEVDWILTGGAKKIFVEYFEGHMTPAYLEKVQQKRAICKRKNIKLIEMWRQDLKPDKVSKLLGGYGR